MTEKGVDFETVDYTQERISADELKQLLHNAGLSPQNALRTNEATYRQYVLGRSLNDEQLISLMADHPELIQRPIVVRGNRAVLARPLDKLAELGIK